MERPLGQTPHSPPPFIPPAASSGFPKMSGDQVPSPARLASSSLSGRAVSAVSSAADSSIRVRPGQPLRGEVKISGAKNSVLKILAATTMAEGRYVLREVPRISDVGIMMELLEGFGSRATFGEDGVLEVNTPADLSPYAPYELVSSMRASISVLGPLLARCGEAVVAFPGGDDFGTRPIDMHIEALQRLGAEIRVSHGYIHASAPVLKGANITLEWPSVGATENIMMASALADGETVIENAAREPEIVDLASFLNRMGARVLGAGGQTVKVEGVDSLSSVDHTPIPDRIETAVFLAALGAAGGEISLIGAQPPHLRMLCDKLGEMDLRTSTTRNGLWAMAPSRLRSVDVVTLPYPGVATDYQPLLVAMLSLADGVGLVTENVFPNRFRYVGELLRMGADIRVEGRCAIVRGRERLSGATVRSTDIRAGAALVVAGLGAEGESLVRDTHHIRRGFDGLVEKLAALGADVEWTSG